jgi:predicted anti-sigma-YlaC factor YlaD
MNPICSEPNVIQYIEKELTEAEMLQMEKHFAHCDACRQMLHQHRVVRLSLIHAASVLPPVDFTSRILAQIPSPYHRVLQTSRDKIIAAAAAVTLAVLGVFSYLVGTQTQAVGEVLSLRWWNNIFFQSFTMVTDTLRLILTLTRLVMSVGVFVIQGVVFILSALGRFLVFSPQGLIAFSVTLTLFLISLSLTLRRQHPHPLKPLRAGRS